MSERFLVNLLREAPRPRRPIRAWTAPVGVLYGIGAYSLTWGQMPRTGLGLVLAASFIWWAFRGVE